MKKTICLIISTLMILSLVPFSGSAKETTGLNTLFSVVTSYCGYYDKNTRPIYSIEYQSTDVIEAHEGDTFTFAPVYPDKEVYIACYNELGSIFFRATELSELTEVGKLNDGGMVAKYVVPKGTVQVRVTCRAQDYNTFLVTKNREFTPAEYYSWIEEKGLSEYRTFTELDKSAYAGKKIVFCGDSVGYGQFEKDYLGAANGGYHSRTAMFPAFVGRVAEMYGIEDWTNKALCGATFSTKMYGNNIVTQTSSAALAGADYIIIEGGVVDTGGYAEALVPLGYISDEYTMTSFAPENTLMGGMERAFYFATKYAKKDSVIICVLPYRVVPDSTFAFAWYRNYQYYAAVCEKWGVYLVDLYNNDTVNAVIDMDTTAGGAFFADECHCTALGYMVCSLEIAKQMVDCTVLSKKLRHMPENLPYNVTKETWEDPDPGKPPVTIDFEENLFDSKTTTKGKLKEDQSGFERTSEFVTSNFIAVSPGDVVYFGPVSPYEMCHITTFDSKKVIVNGRLNSNDVDGACGYLSTGRVILQYTVPEGVSYIRVVFQNTVSPIITINRPFDGVYYREALAAALAKKTVVAPAVGDPTADNFNYHPKTVETEAETDIETTVDTEENTRGCNSAVYSLALILPMTVALGKYRRKKQ